MAPRATADITDSLGSLHDLDAGSGQPIRAARGGGWTGSARLRPRLPALLSTALLASLVGFLAGIGLGFQLGAFVPKPTPPGDVQADSVSPRLQRAYQDAAAGGWAVCGVGSGVACQQLTAGTTEPRVPPSEFGLGWYGMKGLTSVTVSRGHLVVAASLGEGAMVAWLRRIGPGNVFLETSRLTPVEPGGHGPIYFDLSSPMPGHYTVEVDFLAVPSADSSRMVVSYLVGFVVG